MDATDGIAPAVASILQSAHNRTPPDSGPITVTPRSLPTAIDATEANGNVPIIAEIKPTSPTTEGTRDDDPVALAKAMVDGGATALSVLTEPDHFGGSPETLTRIRESVTVPVLRKDFIVREAQLDVVPADIILLIVRFVDDLATLYQAATDRGFQVLVEVHNIAELEEAIDIGADIIGINNRDLAELAVDLSTFETVAPAVPNSTVLIAESGIHTPTDVRRMRAAGANALLVGSSIMAGNVKEKTKELTEIVQ